MRTRRKRTRLQRAIRFLAAALDSWPQWAKAALVLMIFSKGAIEMLQLLTDIICASIFYFL